MKILSVKANAQLAVLTLALVIGLVSAGAASAASTATGMERVAQVTQLITSRLGRNINLLSGPARSFLQMPQRLQSFRGRGPLASVVGSRPNLGFTRFAGGVQSETGSAMCGTNAVVGFNDDDSYEETGFWDYQFGTETASEGLSLVSWASSSNISSTTGSFTLHAFLPPKPTAFTFLVGDPVLVCKGSGASATFYFTNLFEDLSGTCTSLTSTHVCTDVAISTSTGGSTFSTPSPVVQLDANYNMVDKDWLAINPSNPSDLYVTFTNFNFENFSGGTGNLCGPAGTNVVETDIDIVTSTNGGTSWSAPVTVDFRCATTPFGPSLQGSQVAVNGVNGDVLVAYETFGSDFYTRTENSATSTNNGASFGVPVVAASSPFVKGQGDGDFSFGIQGYVRNFEFPSLVYGKPGTANAGTAYLAFASGTHRIPDDWTALITSAFGIGDGLYGFGNILLTSSSNDGARWSLPGTINSTPTTNHDHYQPAAASDKNGQVEVCWYDRESDPNNFQTKRLCRNVTTSTLKTVQSVGASVVNQQGIFIAPDYQGDYDQLTTDSANVTAGFLGGYVNTTPGSQNVSIVTPVTLP